MPTFGLRIDPLDLLFFRDGRPFDAATRAIGGMPTPQTFAGAIRTALLSNTGFDFHKFNQSRKSLDVMAALRQNAADERVISARFRGPWLSLFPRDCSAVPLLESPADLKPAKDRSKGNWARLNPLRAPLPGWTDPELLPVRPTREVDGKAGSQLFTLKAITDYLSGQEPAPADVMEPKQIYGYEDRTGISVDAETMTAAEGAIYSVRLLATRPRLNDASSPMQGYPIGMYAEIDVDSDQATLSRLLANPVPFGGEGHCVRVSVVSPVAWPTRPASGPTKWYLASPAFFPKGLRFPAVGKIKAAVQGPALAISGWDVARNGPRGIRFAAPAGSVYFFDDSGPIDRYLGGSGDNMAEGWGFALPGIWENNNG